MANVNSNKAFSLLEMSISITIISMLIAAILTGQNMKHRQELAQVITDISTITSAVTQFKTTYSNYLPGDLYNASTIISSTTSNGDGDGYLGTGTPNEELFFWQHLQLAGLISGTYDGVTTGTGGLMATSQKYGFYLAHKALNIPSAAVNPTGKLVIQVSKSDGAGLFTTKEGYDFDGKYDNYNPVGTSGTITAADGTGATAGDCVTAGAYKLSNTTGTPCVIYFYLE